MSLLNNIIKYTNSKDFPKFIVIFNLIVLSHFAEHVAQMIQLYLLHWARSKCLGLLGLLYPVLVHSEWMHFLYSLFMVLGIYIFTPDITNKTAKYWWKFTLFLAVLHNIEHFLLLEQAITNQYLFKSNFPISIGQVIFPKIGLKILKQRIELHFLYNIIVIIPMIISLKIQKLNNFK